MRVAAPDPLLPAEAPTEGSRRLRELLQRQTMSAVAKRVACNDKSVRAWAQGNYRPARAHRATMARVLQIPPGEWDEPARAGQAAS